MKTLRYCYLLVVLLFAAGLGSVRAQSFAWAKLARGAVDSAFVQPQASATDDAGNTYVAVNFSDSLKLGNIRLAGPRFWSVAIVKYDSTGAVRWARALANIQVFALAADNARGGIFLTAYNRGGGTWAGAALPISASTNFYAKCSTNGVLQWSNPLPTPYAFGTNTVTTDNAGNAYIGETVQSNSLIGGITVPGGQYFVLKTNSMGVARWVRVLHGDATISASRYVLGNKPGGGFMLCGSFNAALYLGTGTTTTLLTGPLTTNNAFVSSFDSSGTHRWSQLVTSSGSATSPQFFGFRAIAADIDGNGYVTGSVLGNVGGAITASFFLQKYDATGALQWSRDLQSPTSLNNTYGTLLTVGINGATVVVQTPTTPVTLGTLVLSAPYNFVHYSPQGLAQWTVAGTATSYRSLPVFVPTGLGTDTRGNFYTVGTLQGAFATPPPVVQLGAQTTVGRGTITARLNAYANTLRGQVYYDQNANGQQDSNEGLVPQQLTAVLTQGNATIYSNVDTDGVLQAYAGPGPYTLALAQVPRYHTISQPASGSYSGTFSGRHQLVSGQSFGIAPIPNQADIRITLTPYNSPRPGFTTSYHVSIENMGTTTVASGTATLVLDSHFTYVSSTPSATRTGQTLTWTYGNLAPFARLNYDILLSLPTNAVWGTLLTSTANAPLTGDVEPADNTSSLTQSIVSSYDPNSMEVNYERITPTQVAAQQWLEYTIHFQNLGTAAATTVILQDTLDYQKLNPATIQWITQSHNCIWSLTSIGPNTGLLTVRFLNINLPYRNIDVIGSQGFVRFRVRARPTLAVGEIIPNHAGIVFDYNVPVMTNTATTTVFLVTAALGRHEAPAWTAYPNPTTDAVSISADLATAGTVRVEVLDVLGRAVRQKSFVAPAGLLHQALNLHGLAAGVYVLRLTPPTGPATSQRVVLE